MASGSITSWQTDGETVEIVRGFIFSGSKITADGDCSHEIKRSLLHGMKAMTNLDNILKSRDIIFDFDCVDLCQLIAGKKQQLEYFPTPGKRCIV